MSLDKLDTIDAVGIEKETDAVVLTIADAWDWHDPHSHLVALQEKLNAYFSFIESGQIWESYPEAIGRKLIVDIVGRFPIPQVGLDLLEQASIAGAELNVKIRRRYFSGTQGY